MKKTILVLLFCAILVATASCNTSDDIDSESTAAITTIQPADLTTPKDTETNQVENETPTIVETFNNILQKQYTFSQFNSIYPQYEITSKSPVAINVEIPEFEDVIFVFSGEMNGDISTFTMASVNAGGDVLLPEYYGKTFDQIKSEEPENVNLVPTDEIMQHLYQYEDIYIYRDDFYYYIRGYRHGDELTSDNIAMFLYDDTHQRPYFEETDEKTTESEANPEAVDVEGEYDPATNMRYTLIDGGKSYSVCPEGLPDVIKELVIPGEYKGLPVTEVQGKFFDHSIETIIISEGIKEIAGGFFYRCSDIKNIYLPASVIRIGKNAFNCRPTMGGHGFIKSNVIEKIVVAEGNLCYYVDGNCLIEKSSQKIILGCNSSVIPNDGSVKSIGEAAFANCHAIETIVLPKSIIELEYAAFDNCDNLKQVYITSSATENKKIVNFDIETFDNQGLTIYVPDAESLEIYSKIFGSPLKSFKIGLP